MPARPAASASSTATTLQAEVNRIEEEVLEGARNLVVLRNTLEKTEIDTRQAAARTTALLDEVSSARAEAMRVGATSMAQREHINSLKADLKSLEEGTKKLQAGAIQQRPPGQQVRAFRGTGNRQLPHRHQPQGQAHPGADRSFRQHGG